MKNISQIKNKTNKNHQELMVGSSGLEPPTSRLSGVCSNRLSYKPETKAMVEINGIEPLTSCVQSRRSTN